MRGASRDLPGRQGRPAGGGRGCGRRPHRQHPEGLPPDDPGARPRRPWAGSRLRQQLLDGPTSRVRGVEAPTAQGCLSWPTRRNRSAEVDARGLQNREDAGLNPAGSASPARSVSSRRSGPTPGRRVPAVKLLGNRGPGADDDVRARRRPSGRRPSGSCTHPRPGLHDAVTRQTEAMAPSATGGASPHRLRARRTDGARVSPVPARLRQSEKRQAGSVTARPRPRRRAAHRKTGARRSSSAPPLAHVFDLRSWCGLPGRRVPHRGLLLSGATPS